MSLSTRFVRKVSGLPLYLRAIVFERPLRGMNVNSKSLRTYRLLADNLTSAGRTVHAQRVFVYKAIFEFGGFCDC